MAVDREGLREALAREPVELGEGVTPEQVIALALKTIDLGYRVGGENGRANMLAVEADWIMQQWAKTEAWAKDEQAKRHAAEDKLVDARSSVARLSAEVEALREVLKPIAEYADQVEAQYGKQVADDWWSRLHFGHCRAARTALARAAVKAETEGSNLLSPARKEDGDA